MPRRPSTSSGRSIRPQAPGPRPGSRVVRADAQGGSFLPGNPLYLFGGATDLSLGGLNTDFFQLSLAPAAAWKKLTAATAGPTGRAYAATAQLGDTRLMWGGNGDDGPLTELWSFSPADQKWTSLYSAATSNGVGVVNATAVTRR